MHAHCMCMCTHAHTNMKELGRLTQTEHVREAIAYVLLPWDLPKAGGRGRLGTICMWGIPEAEVGTGMTLPDK